MRLEPAGWGWLGLAGMRSGCWLGAGVNHDEPPGEE